MTPFGKPATLSTVLRRSEPRQSNRCARECVMLLSVVYELRLADPQD